MAARIVRACKLSPGDRVLEVGPGRGALTRLLAERGSHLVLVEKDRALAAALEERYASSPEVRVLEGDAVTLDFGEVLSGSPDTVAVGNLPYNAAAPILFNLLDHRRGIRRMVLMFQREVARRLTASPGDRDYGALSLLVQAQSRVESLFDVAPDRFRPVPRVWSAVVRLEPGARDRTPIHPDFARFVHGLHARPRKTVRNSLAEGLGITTAVSAALLLAAGVDPGVRPCHVTPEQAGSLWEAYSGTG